MPSPAAAGPVEMSPEEEVTTVSSAALAARGSEDQQDQQRAASSPPSATKFLSPTPTDQPKEESADSWGDVEKFDGKIVYNPDGSAYIIEDSELSEEDAAELPHLIGNGCIVDGRGVELPAQYQVFPQIASAFYVSRNPAFYSALYGDFAKVVQDKKIVPDVPIMHSYRVFTVRDNKTGASEQTKREAEEALKKLNNTGKDCSSVPVKPILMCFICKLSFGYSKSFVAHAMGDHNVVLKDDEKDILGHKNASAIIQCVGKDKEPLVSFLEPVSPGARPLGELLGQRASSPFMEGSEAEEKPCPENLSRASVSPTDLAHKQNVPETPVSLPQNGSSSNLSSLNSRMLSCGIDLTRKSPAVNNSGSGRSSTSPAASPSPGMSPLLTSMMHYPQPPPNFLTGTTIGVCPDHIGGRPSGVECAKCELILNSSRLGGVGGLAGMHSRNSCKTLKCPKCNWHYKYQETLEIHMKEKHPETETSCIYCIAGQPHPRLARGETYTCGYKPYRCEVCNYSTTTKGNLSIHMQSDKHLNNMQELQNGGVQNTEIQQHQPPPQKGGMSSPAAGHSPISTQSQKPKPTFRCDVCNYETNVARNLRIHMTSEKHTHNMMVLQQNVKHIQTLSVLQQSHHQQQMAAGFEGLLPFHPGLTLPGEKPPPHTEAALADMAYNQALLIQMMTGGQLPPHIPPELAPHMDMGLNPETMEPPPEPADPNPQHLYHCCVCNNFSTDSLESLSHHLAADRTKIREQEILAVVAGHYVCKLCTYKTNLKANFQLHCKTDKHLQRLQHVNHVKEGGQRNEWKLKYISSLGGVQVRCHACDYYTNSAHKLQLHSAGQRHEAAFLLFRHLREFDQETGSKTYTCLICQFNAKTKLQLLQHVRSMKHLQMEQLHQLQRRGEGKDPQTDISEVFQVSISPNSEPQPTSENEMSNEVKAEKESITDDRCDDSPDKSECSSSYQCPYCHFTCDSDGGLQMHVLNQHSQDSVSTQHAQIQSQSREFMCPLCQDGFAEKESLEKHVMLIHSVNSEGLQRLLMLVDQSHWLNNVSRPPAPSPSSVASSGSKDQEVKLNQSDSSEDKDETPMDQDQGDDENKCQTCHRTFKNIDDLCSHQNETGHLELKQTPSGPGYLCWKKGCNQYFQTAHSLQMHFREIHARSGSGQNMAVSEKHVYKYRCNQCSLAFKTMEKLQLHSQYHLIRDATKCVLCGRSFRSVLALHKHVETAHTELSDEEMAAYKHSLMNNPLLLAGISGQILDPSTNELLKRESMKLDGDDVVEIDDKDADDSANQTEENSEECGVYKEQQFLEDYLNSQAIAEDSYNDPNRKYKCHRCKVAFTKQTYLTSHNKTLLHRKGEKLSYPMEKYLDPNRPYKCDVCKESFTQKNILLVHYNSVSHLHKLKRAMQEQQQQNNNNNSVLTHPTASAAAALAASLGVPAAALAAKAVSTEEDDKKPYKCNICKVSYSQGSTLDIHMRSVLHQTRASKIQDLAITGQIDLSKPLIEQPEPQKAQDQHKKLIQDMLSSSPKQLMPSPPSSGSSGSSQAPGSSPTIVPPPAASTPNSTVPTSNTNSHSSVIPSPNSHGMLSCSRCNALFANQEQLTTHQKLYCMFSNAMQLFPPLPTPPSSNNVTTQSGTKSPPPVPLTPTTPTAEDPFPKISLPGKKSSQMYKHLLESFGFDLVMQFNENHQRRQRKEKEENEKLLSEISSTVSAAEESAKEEITAVEPTVDKDEVKMEEEPVIDHLPEVGKSTCQHCNKEFSSVWVLKAHCEEVHRDLVPLDFLEKYAQQIKCEYEKKAVPSSSSQNTSTSTSTTTVSEMQTSDKEEESKTESTPQNKSSGANLDVSTAPSTPTASSTPASSAESIPSGQGLSSTLANAMASVASASSSNPASVALAQHMNEMQAALNVMAASQLQQQLQQFNPMMMGMAGLGMGLPLGLNMPALAAMNLQPPLVPMMMPPPNAAAAFDSMVQGQMFNPQQPGMDAAAASLLAKQQQALLQQQQQMANASQQKRARTRITDEQLKILRAHFDINNSPSEEQIHDMAAQSGLPPKVIKHWFRNTLFKERQRNKDSPYNFNNPPSTTLNLEEYEKTGEAKVTPINPVTLEEIASITAKEERKTPQPPSPSHQSLKESQTTPEPQPLRTPEPPPVQVQQQQQQTTPPSQSQQTVMSPFPTPDMIKTEPKDCESQELMQIEEKPAFGQLQLQQSTVNQAMVMNPLLSRNNSPENLTLSSIINSQLGPSIATQSHMGQHGPNMLPPKMNPNAFPGSQSPVIPSISVGSSNSNDSLSHVLGGCVGSGGGSGGSSGKRANRTRFTDYQIKVLQEFFENNAYPKDDDLEYLSKLLNLSPRVIVVWFQNARQKARKVYENQPPVELSSGGGSMDEAGRFQRTPGLNYQCKKCLLVFQRYYELIRHQKTHCFKEEDAKRSAQAQAAAAQMAAVLSSEDSNSSTIVEQCQQNQPCMSIASSNPTTPSAPITPNPPQNLYSPSPVPPTTPTPEAKESSFQCENCNLVFPRFDLWREHQLVHIMNPNLFPSYPPDSPFGILQQHAQLQQQQQQQQSQQQQSQLPQTPQQSQTQPQLQQQQQQQQQQPQPQQQQSQQQQVQQQTTSQSQQMTSIGQDLLLSVNSAAAHPLMSMLAANKRKLEEYSSESAHEEKEQDHPKDKRLRTTILPEQLDYLYQKYQIESNPSRKMLENIAAEVGLKKRVVQVWFQNTRARERKGQFRAHSQVINKRCPFCPALFKVKSALESHLNTKHSDQCSRGEINIDALPDEDTSIESSSSFNDTAQKIQLNNQSIPPVFSHFSSDMESSLKKYYEESMKRYMSGVQHHLNQNGIIGKDGLPTDLSVKVKEEGETGGGSASEGGGDYPLDLSKPVDLSRPVNLTLEPDIKSLIEQGPLTDLSERSLGCDEERNKKHIDAVRTYLEATFVKAEESVGDFPQAPPTSTAQDLTANNNNTISSVNNNTQQMAQMLQMASLSLPQAAAMAMAVKMEGKDQNQPQAEDVALLQQLYGMGVTNYPQGFMHPALLSATGIKKGEDISGLANCLSRLGLDRESLSEAYKRGESSVKIGACLPGGRPHTDTHRICTSCWVSEERHVSSTCKQSAFITLQYVKTVCPECDLAFTREEDLLRHLESSHPSTPTATATSVSVSTATSTVAPVPVSSTATSTSLSPKSTPQRTVSSSLSPASSAIPTKSEDTGLSVEMDEVVNQITALAAKAVSSTSTSTEEPRFMQPPTPKTTVPPTQM